MGNHKIVWFDDEHQSLESIVSAFDDHDIDFSPFASAEDGSNYLERHYKSVDAIVIDGHFFANNRDQNIDEDGFALRSVLDILNIIKAKYRKDIPYFILSGQQVLTKGSSPAIKTLGINKVYDKLKDEDIIDLCKDIVTTSEASISRQIEYKYSDLLALSRPEFLGPEAFARVLDFLADVESEDLQISFTERLNTMRKVFEAICVSLRAFGIIPEELLVDKFSLNDCVTYLRGKHLNFELNLKILPQTLGHSLKYVIDITQDCSHDKSIESLQLQSDGFFNNTSSVYTYKGIVFIFIQVLHWYKDLIDQYSQKASENIGPIYQRKNSHVDTGKWIEGRIEKIHDNGWAQFRDLSQSLEVGIPKHIVSKNGLIQGQELSITTKRATDKGDKLHVDEIRTNARK